MVVQSFYCKLTKAYFGFSCTLASVVQVFMQGGCVQVDVFRWMCSGGCVQVDVFWWMCSGGCVQVDVFWWMCSGGCVLVDVFRWMCSGRCVQRDSPTTLNSSFITISWRLAFPKAFGESFMSDCVSLGDVPYAHGIMVIE